MPLYMQVSQAIIRDVESGRLAPGTYLPSSRELAGILGVNRKTVVFAYEDLIAQGWLTTSATRGTIVAHNLPDGSGPGVARLEPQAGLGMAGYVIPAEPARRLATIGTASNRIDEGSPDGRLFPADVLIRAFRVATREAARRDGFGYRDSRGSERLRRSIAEMLRTQRGLPVREDNVLITRGSQNGLFLTALALIRPGDLVVVEGLTYEPAVAAFKALGARVVAVGIDEDGIDVDEVATVCLREQVRAIFLTPHHQFPTTVSLRPDRRMRLVELSRRHRFAIIEDDYDHEFHFRSQPLLPIAAIAPEQVIYLGSLSKLMLPTLRIGYVVAPESMVDVLAHYVSLTDGMGNTLNENAAAILIENGELRRHARKARKVYAERREAFAAELARQLGDRISFRMPDGGLALWVRFRGDLDKIEDRASAAGLKFAGSRSYTTRSDAARGLRLGFASLNSEEALAAIALLTEAVRGD
ncbi:PLP-dependent aminotransferase family protein [Croceicoccus ponticola]|nr:PLP-dependent aminotransferase family protein [Croceicoccus ponticola]